MSAHTPAPWTPGLHDLILADDGTEICYLMSADAQARANAALIAAAPELLDACKAMRDAAIEMKSKMSYAELDGYGFHTALNRIVYAIGRAEGRQP